MTTTGSFSNIEVEGGVLVNATTGSFSSQDIDTRSFLGAGLCRRRRLDPAVGCVRVRLLVQRRHPVGYTKIAFESLSSCSPSPIRIGGTSFSIMALRRVRSGRGKRRSTTSICRRLLLVLADLESGAELFADAYVAAADFPVGLREHRPGDRPLLPWTQADAHRQDLTRMNCSRRVTGLATSWIEGLGNSVARCGNASSLCSWQCAWRGSAYRCRARCDDVGGRLVQAADLPISAAAPVRGEFRALIEGGAFWTGGDNIPYSGDIFGGLGGFVLDSVIGDGFLVGEDPSVKPKVGWTVALGSPLPGHALAHQRAVSLRPGLRHRQLRHFDQLLQWQGGETQEFSLKQFNWKPS